MSTHNIEITVDGKSYKRTTESRKLLAHFLRDDLDITSLNIGCDTSQCGACTIKVNGEAVKSCTILAVQANNMTIETVASQATGFTLSIVQQAFQDKHGLQCGFCTPGMVMTTLELLKTNPSPTEDEIRESLHGNICRCTGYHNIIEAIKEAAQQSQFQGASSC